MTIRETLVSRVRGDPRSARRLALDIGLHPCAVHRLMMGADVRLPTIDKLATYFRLELVEMKPRHLVHYGRADG